jgi:hypothetical protein
MSDLREALETAFAASEAPAAEPVVAEAPAAPTEAADTPIVAEQSAAERARDEKGRFAAKAAEEAAQAVAAEATQAAPEQQPQTAAVERKVPTTWRKEAAARWADIPDDIKDEILKRENDARTGIQSYKTDAELARTFKEASKPFERTFSELGVSPVQAYQYLLNADAKLRYSPPQEKARYFSELAREYGIDLQQVVQLPPVSPEYQQMQQELNRLRQQQEAWNRQQTQTLASEIEQFAQDHEHLEAVRPAMAVLLSNGQAKDLQDAYDKAIWADPAIRAALLQKQVSEATKKTESATLAQRQKAAAVSVRGSSPAAGSGNGPKESLRAEVEAAWAAHT